MSTLTEAGVECRLREVVSLRGIVTRPPGWRAQESHSASPACPTEHEPTMEKVAETLLWLDWLDSDDSALVVARLEGARWKMICWRFGISRPTAYRRWQHALGLIAWRLNGNQLPAKCSRRRFMQMTANAM